MLGCRYTVLRLNGIYARQRIKGNRDYNEPYKLKKGVSDDVIWSYIH